MAVKSNVAQAHSPSPRAEPTHIREDFIAQWVAQAQTGHEEAFRNIVATFATSLHIMIYRIVLDWEESRDIAQETFIRAFRALERYQPEGKFQSWLFQIGIHQARDVLRKRRRRISEVSFKKQDPPLEFPIHDNTLTQSELISAIEKAVKQLPENQRIVFVLSEYEGLGYREIAEITRGTIKSVERHLYRARARLREILKDDL